MSRISIRTTLPVLVLAAALPVLAADALAVKPGLWETTTVMTTSGMTMPAEATANMTPAQRAQMEAMMKQMGAQAPKTITDRSCVTADDLKGAFKAMHENQDPSCKFDVVKSTAKHQDLEMNCSKAQSTGHMTLDAIDNGNVRGEMNMKSAQMSMNIKFTSRWLSTSCAGADKN
jgi:Protein of unknown function (DUF3617)